MRTLIAAIGLFSFVTGCTKPTAPPSGSTATDTGAETGQAALASPFGVGDMAPTFVSLIGVDDQSHSLADYADAKAVAIVFTCNHCPVAVAYEDRLVALHNDYLDQGVQLIAINVNNMEADKLPAMKERAAAKGFEFPYLYDPTQQLGRDYGATVTPHVFLLDGERRLAYVGAPDDNMDEAGVSEQFLRNAIDALLAGNVPSKAETKAVGCGIRYE